MKSFFIQIKTANSYNQQESRLEEIQETLSKRNIQFKVEYSTSLHDREIKLSNGWIIKIGR